MAQDANEWDQSPDCSQDRARAALARQDDYRSPGVNRGPRKAEDTSSGCHEMAAKDRARAREDGNDEMKLVLERSADAWEARGNMFKRLEAQREKVADNG